jgi:predicted membrane-bound spermidine synthase
MTIEVETLRWLIVVIVAFLIVIGIIFWWQMKRLNKSLMVAAFLNWSVLVAILMFSAFLSQWSWPSVGSLGFALLNTIAFIWCVVKTL